MISRFGWPELCPVIDKDNPLILDEQHYIKFPIIVYVYCLAGNGYQVSPVLKQGWAVVDAGAGRVSPWKLNHYHMAVQVDDNDMGRVAR